MKLKIIKDTLKEKKLDHILIITELNRFWITNFLCSYGFLIFSKNKENPTLFLDKRYILEAKKTLKNININPLNTFIKIFEKINGSIGIESDLKISILNSLKKLNKKTNFFIINFDELRIIKSHDEINNIKQISKITNKIWEKIKKLNLQKYTEKNIDLKIRKFFLDEEIKNISFNPIVKTGIESAFIHTIPKENKIQSHLLCDFGGKLNGYCSDFTRVIILEKNEKIIKYYKFVKTVSNEIFKLIKPGVQISTLVKKYIEMYKKNNYEICHSLGHGIGLKVHEFPMLYKENKKLLKEGMVFTIEPGIYIENIGGVRYENIVVVTKNGYEILTK